MNLLVHVKAERISFPTVCYWECSIVQMQRYSNVSTFLNVPQLKVFLLKHKLVWVKISDACNWHYFQFFSKYYFSDHVYSNSLVVLKCVQDPMLLLKTKRPHLWYFNPSFGFFFTCLMKILMILHLHFEANLLFLW